jgi:predicted hotdog family 3-hydroxylacyl-ACP dehydratase
MDDQRINKDLALPVTVDKLLPHRLPMCLVDRLVEFDDNSGVVEACIGPDSLLVDKDGTLDRVVLIELIAQSYAAVKGYSDLLGGKEIKKGFLVAAKQIELNGRAAPGDLLRIRVSTTGVVGDFNIADGVITKDDMVLASGNITVWIS